MPNYRRSSTVDFTKKLLKTKSQWPKIVTRQQNVKPKRDWPELASKFSGMFWKCLEWLILIGIPKLAENNFRNTVEKIRRKKVQFGEGFDIPC